MKQLLLWCAERTMQNQEKSPNKNKNINEEKENNTEQKKNNIPKSVLDKGKYFIQFIASFFFFFNFFF